MAAILLDVDGVLHVSGEPISGAADAVRRLRAAGHRVRFVTNSTTMPRGQLGAGAKCYCLHKNRWWQTADGPKLDSGAFVAGLEFASGIDATVLGKPSPEYFAAALESIDADPELAWMVGDDVEGDVRGAQRHGMRTVLVRTGKFRPDEVEELGVVPDGIVSSVAQLPDWLEANI